MARRRRQAPSDDGRRRFGLLDIDHALMAAVLSGGNGLTPPGRALDAGRGHGSDTLWLAARGRQVTAVGFSATAVNQARSAAETGAGDQRGQA
jgi:2-polyprenyl-3-methyl-5-hydroxy-6-metoxy-1,4-benzoquinol methylase